MPPVRVRQQAAARRPAFKVAPSATCAFDVDSAGGCDWLRWFSDIGVGSVGAGAGLASFHVWWLGLQAVSKPVDDAGNVAGAHIAPSASEWHRGTRNPDQAPFDRLHCVLTSRTRAWRSRHP